MNYSEAYVAMSDSKKPRDIVMTSACAYGCCNAFYNANRIQTAPREENIALIHGKRMQFIVRICITLYAMTKI